MEDLRQQSPLTPLLISFNAEDVRKQASASTKRFDEGRAVLRTSMSLVCLVHFLNWRVLLFIYNKI